MASRSTPDEPTPSTTDYSGRMAVVAAKMLRAARIAMEVTDGAQARAALCEIADIMAGTEGHEDLAPQLRLGANLFDNEHALRMCRQIAVQFVHSGSSLTHTASDLLEIVPEKQSPHRGRILTLVVAVVLLVIIWKAVSRVPPEQSRKAPPMASETSPAPTAQGSWNQTELQVSNTTVTSAEPSNSEDQSAFFKPGVEAIVKPPNNAPVLEIVRVSSPVTTPGETLTVELRASDPDGDKVRFEYRVNGGQWQKSQDGLVRIVDLQPVELRLECRALDSKEDPSRTLLKIWRLDVGEATGPEVDPNQLLGRTIDILTKTGDSISEARVVGLKRADDGTIRLISLEQQSKVSKKKKTVSCGFDAIKEIKLDGLLLVYEKQSGMLKPPPPMKLVCDD